jgi:hypothetical protein
MEMFACVISRLIPSCKASPRTARRREWRAAELFLKQPSMDSPVPAELTDNDDAELLATANWFCKEKHAVHRQ